MGSMTHLTDGSPSYTSQHNDIVLHYIWNSTNGIDDIRLICEEKSNMCRPDLEKKVIKSDCLRNICVPVSRFWEGWEID